MQPPHRFAELSISIHALREERDLLTVVFCKIIHLFQSTRSARSATYFIFLKFCLHLLFQSTRSARSATTLDGLVIEGV